MNELHLRRQVVQDVQIVQSLAVGHVHVEAILALEVGAGGGFVFRVEVGLGQRDERGGGLGEGVGRGGLEDGRVRSGVVQGISAKAEATAGGDGQRLVQIRQVAEQGGDIHRRRRLLGRETAKGHFDHN